MAKRYTRSTAITAELAARHLGRYDKNGTRASIGGSARGGLVELRVQGVERDELVKSIDQRRLGPARSQRDAAEAIVINNGRVRQVARRRGANAIVKTARQSATLWLGSVAVDAIEPLAAARRTIRTRMVQQKGGQKRRRQRVSWRRSQRWAWSNPIVKQNLGGSEGPLRGSTILWRTKPIDGRLPLSRKE
jgi:hypothetical protein